MRVLTFCPVNRLQVEVVRNLVAQTKTYDLFFAVENTHDEWYKNIQEKYEQMKFMSQEYDRVWIVEDDTIPPVDALEKLLEVDADVVSGVYVGRHGTPKPNLLNKVGTVLEWSELVGEQIEIGGGSMGCLLVKPHVFEGFSFLTKNKHAPDMPFMDHCRKFKQVARLDVLCGHVKLSGEILHPKDFINQGET